MNVSCRKRIANAFNMHFSSLAKNLNKDIDLNNESIPNFCTYLPKQQQNSFFLAETSSKEIIDIIKEFKNGKSSDIPIIVIKHIKEIIAPYMSKFINACISTGTFPSSLKLGKITPIHKKGPKNEVSNYRPVSTLPIFGKIFEKIIYSRLYSFLTDHNILSNTQFGFRKHHSTSYAVNYSVNLIKQFQYEGKSTIGVFIDLSKAFDTIDHTTLLSKLECYGIRGIAHDLLRSYLSNRYQLINIDGTHSDKELVSYGVPQGSVLGPLLFLIYINDLQNCFMNKNVKFVLYADDTNIFISCTSFEEGISLANTVLDHVRNYMRCNLLHINLDKSCYMYFPCKKPSQTKNKNEDSSSTTNQDSELENTANNNDIKSLLYIGNSIIPEVDEVKFLGITFDGRLSWDKHVENLYKRLKSAIAVIKRIKPCIGKENFKTLYFTLFECHILYGISVWGGIPKFRLDKIFRLQKKCIRIFFGDFDQFMDKYNTCARTRPYGEQFLTSKFYMKEHTKPLFNANRILTVQNLYRYTAVIELIKILIFGHPKSLLETFELSSRNNRNLIILSAHNNSQFHYQSSVMWNSLLKPLQVPSIHQININVFKSKFKKHLLKQQEIGDETVWTNANNQH